MKKAFKKLLILDISKYLEQLIDKDKISSLVLFLCTVASIMVSNSSFGFEYANFWHRSINNASVEFVINDVLMSFFFFLVGLELKREILVGKLSSYKNALVPLFGALGGMLFPALVYIITNSQDSIKGFGIPTATDIVFAVGVLSIFKNKIPKTLFVLLLTLAVVDDLGAIVLIAIFYSDHISYINITAALLLFFLLIIIGKTKIQNFLIYLVAGVALWFFIFKSGIHPTISGVLLAMSIPLNTQNTISFVKMERIVHNLVGYIILPLFVLANTAIIFGDNFSLDLIFKEPNLGIFLGLVLGKPIGIFLFILVAVKLRICKLPEEITWDNIFGLGIIAGIGFTMSIFITILAFNDQLKVSNAKLSILFASLFSSILGLLWIKFFADKRRKTKFSNKINLMR